MSLPLAQISSAFASAFDADRTPRVQLTIGGDVYDKISDYYYETDVMTLGDSFSATIPDANGKLVGKPKVGDKVSYYVADPEVAGGKPVRKVLGRVTHRNAKTNSGGTIISVTGADLGWHLSSTTAPVWFRLRGATLETLLTKVIDPSWGIIGVRSSNDLNRKLKLGRAGAAQVIQGSQSFTIVPPVQTDVGQSIADLLVEYARLQKLLVNVSSDGYLQIFAPNYTQPVAYKFQLHQIGSGREESNNIIEAELDESIDGIYTQVDCYTSVLNPGFQNTQNPNAGRYKGRYSPVPNPLPFNRPLSFTDQNQLSKDAATVRAQWKWQRGIFDSWTYTIKVLGHQQNGVAFDCDTMCEVYDDVNDVNGKFYVQKVKYVRSRQEGVVSYLTLKKPNLLAA